MMPVYYTDAAVTEEDFKIAQASWDMILSQLDSVIDMCEYLLFHPNVILPYR